jgi:ATP-dependent DNA helicase RecQ
VRHRYRIDRRPDDQAALVSDLMERFAAREDAEIGRVGMPLALATLEGCRTNALVGYFGEQRDEPCGHCSFCISGRALPLPSPLPVEPLPAGVDEEEIATLVSAHARALATPRQQARLLCGITSPATSKARLGKHPLFGRLADQRFADVVAWRERAAV